MSLTIEASTAARFDVAVAFAADGAYARYATFAAAQIAAVTPERTFDICLCGPEMPAEVPGLAHHGFRRVGKGVAFTDKM